MSILLFFMVKCIYILGFLLIPFLYNCKRKDFWKPNETFSCVQSIDTLGINQIQFIASHNSYRLRTYDPLYTRLKQMQFLVTNYNLGEWDYTHEPLTSQLNNFNVRGFELDFYMDPDGGKFYHRQGNKLINETTESFVPELLEPGLKILHFADLDYNTNNYTLKSGLQEIKNWSDAHPNHLPIFIMMEPKEDGLEGNLPFPLSLINFTEITKFDAAGLDLIDNEIKDVFGENLNKVITPDMVRNGASTLNKAITTKGWPKISVCRGKIIFVALFNDEQTANYLNGHPSLQGRPMFVYSDPGKPEAAFIKFEEAEPNKQYIQALVRSGYFIRTRSDIATFEAKTGNYSRLNNAIESGAQMISTDYYRPDARHATSTEWSDYKASFANDRMFRINPVNTREDNYSCELGE